MASVRVRDVHYEAHVLRKGVSLVLTPATSTKRMRTRPKWNPRCTRPRETSGIDAQHQESTGAGVACVRVRDCAKEAGEPCTHACHLHETRDNEAKTEFRVY